MNADIICAKIRLQTALMLARDIQAYRCGDAARFDRMVDSHGKGVINFVAAKENVAKVCRETNGQFPMTARFLLRWLEG